MPSSNYTRHGVLAEEIVHGTKKIAMAWWQPPPPANSNLKIFSPKRRGMPLYTMKIKAIFERAHSHTHTRVIHGNICYNKHGILEVKLGI